MDSVRWWWFGKMRNNKQTNEALDWKVFFVRFKAESERASDENPHKFDLESVWRNFRVRCCRHCNRSLKNAEMRSNARQAEKSSILISPSLPPPSSFCLIELCTYVLKNVFQQSFFPFFSFGSCWELKRADDDEGREQSDVGGKGKKSFVLASARCLNVYT